MKRLRGAFVAAGMIALSATTSAEAKDFAEVGEMVRLCRLAIGLSENRTYQADNLIDAAGCISYLRGVSDYMGYLCGAGTDGKGNPLANTLFRHLGYDNSGYSGMALARIFVQFAERNPTKWNLESPILTMLAFQDASPCSGTK